MEVVIPPTPKPLQDAVAAFVSARRALSDREERPAWFAAWKSTVDPHIFVDGSIPGDFACSPAVTLATVLPFFDAIDEVDASSRPAKVPVRFTVGSSWRWHEARLPHGVESVQAALDLFTGDQCAKAGGLGAEVTLVRPLGVFYVAWEGKNRVAFLARQGVEYMPCLLSERDYPAANRLRLVAVREGPLCCWICVLDGEYAVTIPYPEFTLPILRAYGVKQSAWSAEYPMLATVMNSFRLQPKDSDAAMRNGPAERVSLSHLKRREKEVAKADVEYIALIAHPGLALDRNYLRNLALVIAVVLLGGGLLKSLQVAVDSAASMIGLSIGALVGALSILFLPVARRHGRLSDAIVAVKAADDLSGPASAMVEK